LARYSLYVRAMSQARPIHPGITYFITRRTERRHCLLRPDPLMNAFILYALIVSARSHGILLHAFCAMSTHIHYVVTDPRGQLPQFLAMFHRTVARGVKAMRKWEGAVWNRSQASVVQLCSRQAIVEKIAYTLANPVKAGLVWSAHEWPGAKTTVNQIGQKRLYARRPKQCLRSNNPQWVQKAKLSISLPPSIAPSDAKAFRDDIRHELTRLENAAHIEIPKHKVLGALGAAKVSPQSRITSYEPIRQRNPTIAIGRGQSNEIRLAAMAKIRAFRTSYREALAKWRAGDRSVIFPAGTYAMRVFHGASVDTTLGK